MAGPRLLTGVDGLCAKRSRVGRGRCRRHAWPERLIGTVITTTAKQGVVEIIRRVTQGEAFAAMALVAASCGGSQVHTAWIERVHATVRERLARLTRRCRHAARPVSRREAGLWVVGCTSTLCWPHHEVNRRAARARDRRGDVLLTPALASGRTDPVWSVRALLTFRIPLPAWVAPQRRRWPGTLVSSRKKPVSARPRPVLRLRKGAFCASTMEGGSTRKAVVTELSIVLFSSQMLLISFLFSFA
jgi:hypothetical protein